MILKTQDLVGPTNMCSTLSFPPSPSHRTADPIARDSLSRVIDVFERCLGCAYQTLLVGGYAEPEYLPAVAGGCAEIRFREDFLSSALHEVAHWCIAGEVRRQCRDFGYWYRPEGRDARQQMAFERAEVRPQATEWLFSRACKQVCHLRRDIHGPREPASGFDFAAATSRMAQQFCVRGLPPRAAIFAAALAREFGCSAYLDPDLYAESELT